MKRAPISSNLGVKSNKTGKTPPTTKLPRSGFIYQVEFCPNPDCITIHTRTRFPKFDDDGLDLRTVIKNVNKPGWGIKGKIHPFYKDLAKIRGLKSASDTDGYTLQCLKVNSLFSWDEILPKILKFIQTHIAGKRKMVASGPDKHPSAAELRSIQEHDEMDLFRFVK